MSPVPQIILHDAPVMFQVIEGLRPTRPAGDVIPDHIWNIMEQCWAHNFADRPTILGIMLELAMHERLAGDLSFLVCPLFLTVTSFLQLRC
jgi:hypothetical protein